MRKCSLIFVPLFACLLPSCVNNEPIVEECAVTFVTNGAYEEIPLQRVKKGSVVVEPSTPIRQGYTFKGWFKDPAFEDKFSFSEKVFNDITLYAEWGDIKEYTVHFFVDGDEQPELVETVEYSQKVIKPETPTREYNVFDGWYEDEDCEGKKFDFDVPLTRDATTINLYGQFVFKQARVTYNPNGGTMIGSDYEDVVYGGTIAEAPEAKLTNFILAGWYTDKSLDDKTRFVFESDKGTPTPVEDDITLYAKWERTGYTVKWLNYDGELLETDVNVAPESDPVYDGATPNRAGTLEFVYMFNGWSPALTPVTSDQTYVAQYTAINSSAYFKVTIPEESNETTFEFAFEGTLDYVDWGDGTTDTSASHTYETAGDYDVRIFGDVDNISIAEGEGCLKEIYLGGSNTYIPYAAFKDCTNLISVNFADTITSIDSQAFSGCRALDSFNFASVTSIGFSAFMNCKSLLSIIIPASVTSIGDIAFANCSSLTIYCEAESKPDGWDKDWNINGRPCYWGYISHGTDGDYDYVDTKSGVHLVKYKGGATSVTVPSELIKRTVIGLDYTFEGSASVQSVTLPDSIISIGNNAFQNCSSLSSVNLPDNVTSIGNNAFQNCSSLSSVNLPDNVTSIGNNAFQNCPSLSGSIVFSSNLTSIGNYAFNGCSSLSTVVIPDNVTSIGNVVFSSCGSLFIYCAPVSKPSGWAPSWNQSNRPCYWGYLSSAKYDDFEVISTESGTFYRYLGSDTKVTIPTEVDGVNIDYIDYAFMDNKTIQTVEFDSSSSLTSIGQRAFYNSSVSLITIPNSVTSIGESAFERCSSPLVVHVKTPSNLTSIGKNAFSDSSLTSIDIPEGVTSIDYHAFYACRQFVGPIIFPSTLNSIGEYAFNLCDSLTSITIPNSVTSIGDSAFLNCDGLTSVQLLANITSIERGTFCGCSSLLSITIPASVTTINKNAFGACLSLSEVVITNTTTKIQGSDDMFKNCASDLAIKVPNGLLNEYKNDSKWNIYNLVGYDPADTNIKEK